MAGFSLRDAAGHSAGNCGRCAAGLHRFVRRLCDHQHGGGRGFGNPSDGYLRHRAARRESSSERDLGADRSGIRIPDFGFRKVTGNMNRRYFLMGAAGLAACSPDRRPRLNIFNWSDYIAPDTVPKFEAEFGIRVRYGIYESNEEMLARVMGGNSGWDVVFPTDYIVKPMLANDLLAPVHRELLPNLPQLEPRFQRPDWDPHLNWDIPYK